MSNPFGLPQKKEGLEKILEESKGKWIFIISSLARYYAKYIEKEGVYYKFRVLSLVDMPEGARYMEEITYFTDDQFIVCIGDYEEIVKKLKENPTPFSRYKGKRVEILLKNNKVIGEVTKVGLHRIEMDNRHLVSTEEIEAILEK